MEYTIIAGVNGAGKSSLYNSGTLVKSKLGVRLNVDELVQKEYDNKWQDDLIQLEAGKRIVRQLKECIANGISFNQETTLSGNSTERYINEARSHGFIISLYYVALRNMELSLQRVASRVENNGHGVYEDILRNRYSKSFANLVKIMPLCDNVIV